MVVAPDRGKERASYGAFVAFRSAEAIWRSAIAIIGAPPRARAAVVASAVMSRRSRSMPRTMAAATSGAVLGFTPADTATVSGGLIRFSASKPGVRVSGGNTHAQ